MNFGRRLHNVAHLGAMAILPIYFVLRLSRPNGDGLEDILIGMGVGAALTFILSFTRLADDRPAP